MVVVFFFPFLNLRWLFLSEQQNFLRTMLCGSFFGNKISSSQWGGFRMVSGNVMMVCLWGSGRHHQTCHCEPAFLILFSFGFYNVDCKLWHSAWGWKPVDGAHRGKKYKATGVLSCWPHVFFSVHYICAESMTQPWEGKGEVSISASQQGGPQFNSLTGQ